MAEFGLTGARIAFDATTMELTGAQLVAGVAASFELTGARVSSAGVLSSVEAGNSFTDDPFQPMVLSAIVSGIPDTVAWSLVSATNGAAPVLIGTGAAVTYYAPATVNGTVLTWRVTATKLGQANVTDTVVHTIRNHAGPWVPMGGGTYLPVQISALADDVATPMPTFSYTSTVTGQSWGWLYGEDFLTNVDLGGFTTMTTGDTGKLDPASPGGAAYATSWKAKTNASSVIPGSFAQYSANKTMSVYDTLNANGVLAIWMHKEGGTGQAWASAVKPLLPQADPNYMTYGRIEWRMRTTDLVGVGFGVVALLIDSNNWPDYGEMDWPEGSPMGDVNGNYHFAQATDSHVAIDGGARVMSDWHKYFIEWFPDGGLGRMRVGIDGVTIRDSTDRVALSPMELGFLIQTGTLGLAVTNGTEAVLEIDWISIWNWTGGDLSVLLDGGTSSIVGSTGVDGGTGSSSGIDIINGGTA